MLLRGCDLVGRGGLAALVLVSVVLLSGCGEQGVRSGPSEDVERVGEADLSRLASRLGGFEQWRLSGRMSLSNGEDAWHASVDWQQSGGFFRLNLVGPFGAGALAVSGDARRVVLRSAKGDEFVSKNPDALVERELGVALPVQGMRWWVRGLPIPGQPSQRRFDAQGRLLQLQQAGWVIDYRDRVLVQGLWMPRKLFAAKQSVRLRLSIGRWSLGTAVAKKDSR